jgi:hypothetical protein
MAFALSRPSRQFLADRGQDIEDSLLRAGLRQAKQSKKDLRDALLRVTPRLGMAAPGSTSIRSSPTGAVAPEDVVKDVECNVEFNANTGLTTMLCSASVRRGGAELAPVLDPRSWAANGEVIGAAFIVSRDAQGQYAPAILTPARQLQPPGAKGSPDDSLPLGQEFEHQLLYEYARSEVASFENILRIKRFVVSDTLIQADYQLFDCLNCTFGFFSAPGGLTANEGYVKAFPLNDYWWSINVKKVIQVRDLTPQDPGNKYDFGEWVNSTIGGALSQWVRDAASALSPVL